MHGESDPGIMIAETRTHRHTHTNTVHLSDRQPSEQTARLADMQGPGQRALFRVHDCMQARHQTAFITPVCWPANACSPSYLGRPFSQTDTQALTISRQSMQSAACYQLSNWISGTNVITAGVFIYIIIITALPRGARGERQGLGRDEGWDRREGREGGGWTVKTAGRVKSLPVEKNRQTRRQTWEE